MPDTTFESILAGQLRTYAEGGVRPFDRRAIATDVIAAGRTSPRRWSVGLRRGSMVPVLVALVGLALVAIALMAGGQIHLPQFPAVVTRTAEPTHPVATPLASPVATTAPSATPRTTTPGQGLLTIDGDVYLTDGDAGNRQKILDGEPWIDGRDNPGGWYGARWSGSGRYVAAALGDTTVVSRTDGTEVRRFDGGWFIWAPSDDRLFVGVDAGGRVEDLATGKSWSITPPPGSGFSDAPAFSPDGTHPVAHVCTPCSSDTQGSVDLWVYDIVSGSHIVLTHSPNLAEAWPVWSPDGKAIAFWRQLCGTEANGDVCRMDVWSVAAAGGPELRITTDSVSSGPVWSPDSRHLAFSIQRSIEDAAMGTGGLGTAIVTVPDATSQPTEPPLRLFEPVDGLDVSPVRWSVDLQRLYMIRYIAIPQQATTGPQELWSYAATGGDPRTIAIGPGMNWDVR